MIDIIRQLFVVTDYANFIREFKGLSVFNIIAQVIIEMRAL